MRAIHFDAVTGQEIPTHEVLALPGVTNFCSWRRLVEVFRDSGELKPGEQLASFQIDERGITYRIR